MKILIIITYLIYVLTLETLFIGGSGYVIFVLHRSPLWIIIGILGSLGIMHPKTWKQLINNTI